MANGDWHGIFGDRITRIEMDADEEVFCDLCGQDMTDMPDQGGFLFATKTICPDCAPAYEERLIFHNEQQHIRARCPVGKSFADWVREDLR